jgi:hypothetical protein
MVRIPTGVRILSSSASNSVSGANYPVDTEGNFPWDMAALREFPTHSDIGARTTFGGVILVPPLPMSSW